MSAFDELMAYTRETQALSQVLGRLHWDMETMMPKGASAQRGTEVAALERVVHERRGAPQVGEWLAGCAPEDAETAAHLREIRRSYDRACKVPGDLAAELARLTSEAHPAWAKARAEEDFASFAPILNEILDRRREEAVFLAEDGQSHYDALLQDYEPGATAAELAAMFDALRPRLVALRDRIAGSDRSVAPLAGDFPPEGQMKVAQMLATRFGYGFDTGRIDKAVHPFSSGSGQDVRITTRTMAHDPLNCFYSTIHEAGHAVYEQRVGASYHLTALGSGVSMGVHESQSRIFENQLGRSQPFCGWLFAQMQDAFVGLQDDADAFYAQVNRVAPGYIRTEADEVHYNLHILLRFDIERQLIAGDLTVADLPEAWDARFLADFGVAVDKPSNGCLQDVHWSAGLFGYFPTYTLGNVYAGCLYEALRAALPDLDAQLAAGDPSAAVDWLTERLHRFGSLREARDTIYHATGKPPSEAPLLDYLEAKFGALYSV